VFRKEFGISLEMIGRLILINFGTQILRTSGHAVRRSAGLPPSAVIATRAASWASYAWESCRSSWMSLFRAHGRRGRLRDRGGIIEVLISPIVDALPGRDGLGDEPAPFLLLLGR
jgi:hypothetical protein